MRRATSGRRRPKDSLQDRLPIDTLHLSTIQNRDSDASFCSSRPSNSSIGIGRATPSPIIDRVHQASAIRVINAYLAFHSSSTVLKPPLPSAKDITAPFAFSSLTSIGPLSNLKKIFLFSSNTSIAPSNSTKSALKAPGTLHSWPSLLAVIHWLIELAFYNDHIASSSTTTTNSLFRDNRVLTHIVNCYSLYIRGDDDGVEDLDNEFNRQM
uniref:Kinetochore protein NDC80 n=1 Tax=Nelumbo nucifera TaxID=4432 RepID=A0A822XH38_NELNU|nr:TPA_asm: hypothetical protein HUJ06_019812 [Nelumbo nucifera]